MADVCAKRTRLELVRRWRDFAVSFVIATKTFKSHQSKDVDKALELRTPHIVQYTSRNNQAKYLLTCLPTLIASATVALPDAILNNYLRMHSRVISWADSFARAHTWRKCSLVHKIIQHVEYLAPMARVTKFTENDTAHWRNLLSPTVTSGTLAQLIALVCAGLNRQRCSVCMFCNSSEDKLS